MSQASDLSRRYRPGEDVWPLLQALAGGVLGAVAALVLDALVAPAVVDARLIAPALWAAALPVGGAGQPLGAGVGVLVAVSGALVYAYGQVRRFVPGGAVVKGLAWGALLAVVTLPTLLPQLAAGGLVATAAPADALLAVSVVAVELGAGWLLYGAVVGALNPERT